MPTSETNFSAKCRQITDVERPDHHYLSDGQVCYYFGEYSSGQGYGHSQTNQLISNIQKPVTVRGTGQWRYKQEAIHKMGRCLRAAFKAEFLPRMSFVPIPPSKPPQDEGYDDRMMQIASACQPEGDVRPVLESTVAREPEKSANNRMSPEELEQTIAINHATLATAPLREYVVLVDDVIVTGKSFVACRNKILQVVPDANVIGMFIARRAVPPVDWGFEVIS